MPGHPEFVYGPYDVDTSLYGPTESGRRLLVLAVENFSMRYQDEEVGLDFIESNNRYRAEEAINEDLTWTGDVWFSTLAGNKRQLKPEAFNLLVRDARDNHRRIDWDKGFYVRFTGKYWRHAFTSDTRTPGTLPLQLFIDTPPSIRERPHRTQEGDKYRRFFVDTKSKEFSDLSQTSISQARIVKALEFVKTRKGQFTSANNRTVAWYDDWYKILIHNVDNGEEVKATTAQVLSLNSFPQGNEPLHQMLARHINSPSFQEILTKHKNLISKENLTSFIIKVHRTGTPPRAIQEQLEMQQELAEAPVEGDLFKLEELDGSFIDESLVDDTKVLIDLSSSIPPSRSETSTLLSSMDQTPGQITPKPDPSLTGSTRTEPSSSRASTSNPDALRLIPPVMFERQTLPADCQWSCPVRGCSMVLDFKNDLPRWALDLLTHKEKKYLSKGGWSAKSSRIQSYFLKMLNLHYSDHLADLGLVTDGRDVTIRNQ
ncbi:hypothetical protein FRB91_002691 [Serendipita sp. 411]|nr:hypothetical protein FRB91_002691 [Serendipita sp. 411]